MSESFTIPLTNLQDDLIWPLKAVRQFFADRLQALEIMHPSPNIVEMHQTGHGNINEQLHEHAQAPLNQLQREMTAFTTEMCAPETLQFMEFSHPDVKAATDFLRPYYEEGRELAKALGKEAAKIKLGAATDKEVDERLASGKYKNLEDMVGRYHAAQAADMMRRQSWLEAGKELGHISADQYTAELEAMAAKMDAQGHHGIRRMVENNPRLKDFLAHDITPITVTFAKGKKTQDVPALSNMTRAAFLNGEEQHAQKPGNDPAHYMERAYQEAMGEGYAKAFKERRNVVLTAVSQYNNLPSPRISKSMDALMNDIAVHEAHIPVTGEAHGFYALEAEKALLLKGGLAMHDTARPAFGDEIRASLQQRKTAAWLAARGVDPETEAGGADKKKVAPGSDGLPDEAAANRTRLEAPKGDQEISTEPFSPTKEGRTTEKTVRTAEAAAKESKWILPGRLVSSAVCGALIYDGVTHCNGSSQNARNEQDNTGNFLRAAEASIGTAGLAASWLVKKETIRNLANRMLHR